MATIKYLIQSKSKSSSIYVRLSAGRKKVLYKKTGLVIDPKNWSEKTGFAKPTTVQNKNINTDLRKLHNHIIDSLNSLNNLNKLNSEWLSVSIDNFFGRTAKSEVHINTFVGYAERFIKRLDYKVTTKGKKGVSKATKKKYQTILNKIIAYQKYYGVSLTVKDIDLDFREKLIVYFRDIDKLSDNSIGRYLKFVKSFCIDASRNKIEVSEDLIHFKGYTVKIESPSLSFTEINKIQKANIEARNLNIARDWLVIGCYTGQRVSDILRMNKNFIENIQGYDFIVLTQTKTNKIVQIPIHSEVLKILKKYNGEFPPSFTCNSDSSKTMFNRYIKKVCKIAGINQPTKGNLFDAVAKRNIEGVYEKYKLVSSHICRRSFATNFYGNPKFPTPLLMNITAHSSERDFLLYVKKKPIDHSLELAKIFQKEAERDNTSNLKIVRDAVNE